MCLLKKTIVLSKGAPNSHIGVLRGPRPKMPLIEHMRVSWDLLCWPIVIANMSIPK